MNPQQKCPKTQAHMDSGRHRHLYIYLFKKEQPKFPKCCNFWPREATSRNAVKNRKPKQKQRLQMKEEEFKINEQNWFGERRNSTAKKQYIYKYIYTYVYI